MGWRWQQVQFHMKPTQTPDTLSFFIRSGVTVAAVFLLSSCAALHRAALRDTEVYFRSETLASFPPKPPEFQIPLLNSRPTKSVNIGNFRFTTERGEKFAIESAVHNARKCGADAVHIRKLESWAEPYSRYVPAQTNYAPSSQWASGSVWIPARPGVPGHWARQNAVVQGVSVWYTPAHTESGWIHYTHIDAQMLRVPAPPPR